MADFELVLPAYNEAATLPALVQRAIAAASDCGATPATFNLIVVDNGSTDDTAAVLRRLQQAPEGAWLQVVEVPVNRGYGHGLMQGLQRSRAATVGYSHADLQCDPKDACTAWRQLQAAPQPKVIVKGSRRGRARRERLVSRVFEAMAHLLLGLRVHELNAQPKVFPRALLAHLAAPPRTFAFDLYLLYCARRAGYALQQVPVDFAPRQAGVSKWAATLLGRARTIAGMIRYMWQLRRREGRL